MNQQLNTPDIPEIVDRWLEILIDQLHEALDLHNIGKLDGALWKSIVGEVIRSGKDIDSIIVEFKQHGRFLDMGVGRGMPIGSRKSKGDKQFLKKRNAQGQLNKVGRTPKPWYSKTKTREIARLREILASNRADFMLADLENVLKTSTPAVYPA